MLKPTDPHSITQETARRAQKVINLPTPFLSFHPSLPQNNLQFTWERKGKRVRRRKGTVSGI